MTLQSLTAADVMRGGIKTVSPRTTLPELEEAFVRDHVTGYPVVDGTTLAGIISTIDIVRLVAQGRG